MFEFFNLPKSRTTETLLFLATLQEREVWPTNAFEAVKRNSFITGLKSRLKQRTNFEILLHFVKCCILHMEMLILLCSDLRRVVLFFLGLLKNVF